MVRVGVEENDSKVVEVTFLLDYFRINADRGIAYVSWMRRDQPHYTWVKEHRRGWAELHRLADGSYVIKSGAGIHERFTSFPFKLASLSAKLI